jgi:LCP family protein required for cell wall assembly
MTNKPRLISDFTPNRGFTEVGKSKKHQKQAVQFPNVGMTLSSYVRSSQSNSLNKTPVFKISKLGRLKRMFKFSLKRSAILFGLIVLITVGWVGGKFLYNTHKVFGGSLFSALHTTKLQGEDVGRVNILLAGNSSDDGGHDGADLTDSIMIVSLDIKNNKAFLLSVPRDLWVNIPSYGHAKINAAYVYGKNNGFTQVGLPAGGMGLLQKVIEQDFGITINYYGLIDYTALKQSVDAVGGVDITIATGDVRGLYDPSIDWGTKGSLVKLTNGTHHFDGRQALDLARARGDAYGSYGFANADFDRTEHQRQLLVALKSKVISAGVLSNPTKLSSLSDSIGGNVKSNMTISEVRRMYDLFKNIDSNSIQSLSLVGASGKNLLSNYTTNDGQSALIPSAGYDVYDGIQAFVTQHMSADPVVQEDATLAVLNATNTLGLATKAKTILASKNINVVFIGDAKATQAKTSIIDLSANKMPSTKAALVQIYGNNFVTVNPYAGVYTTDFIVLLGNDQVPAPTTTTKQ